MLETSASIITYIVRKNASDLKVNNFFDVIEVNNMFIFYYQEICDLHDILQLNMMQMIGGMLKIL